MLKLTKFLFASMTIAAAFSTTACDSADPNDDNDDQTGGTAGTGSTTGGTGGTGTTGGNTLLQPDASGWMDAMSTDWNDMGINGAWYPYGDQYGAAKCTLLGMHSSAECSVITRPDPAVEMYPQPEAPFRFCTSGDAAQVLDCDPTLPSRCEFCSGCPDDDYSTMWGAGIGFDLLSDGGSATAPKHPWNPDTYGVIGFSFEFVDTAGQPLPPLLGGIRVEIPMELNAAEGMPFGLMAGDNTDNHPDGAPYWGATDQWPSSPVAQGKNCVTWDKIQAPGMKRYMFDKTRMLGIQFHVPTNNTGRKMYNFCIQNVTMLRTLPADCPTM
jgi:hypothetical protein